MATVPQSTKQVDTPPAGQPKQDDQQAETTDGVAAPATIEAYDSYDEDVETPYVHVPDISFANYPKDASKSEEA